MANLSKSFHFSIPVANKSFPVGDIEVKGVWVNRDDFEVLEVKFNPAGKFDTWDILNEIPSNDVVEFINSAAEHHVYTLTQEPTIFDGL